MISLYRILVFVLTFIGALAAALVWLAFDLNVGFGSDHWPKDVVQAFAVFTAINLIGFLAALVVLGFILFHDPANNERALACVMVLSGVANMAVAFWNIDRVDAHSEQKIPVRTWWLSATPFFFWTVAGIIWIKELAEEEDEVDEQEEEFLEEPLLTSDEKEKWLEHSTNVARSRRMSKSRPREW